MPRKLSEMARARAIVRRIESQDRKKLRSEMRGAVRYTIEDLETGRIRRKYYGDYDSKQTMVPSTEWANENQPIKTLNDILIEFDQTISDKKTKHHRRNDLDKLVDTHISDEVRQYWIHRIGRGTIKIEENK